jgi:hypothetical protein
MFKKAMVVAVALALTFCGISAAADKVLRGDT